MARLLLVLIATSCALAAWAAPLTKSELAILRERDERYPAKPPSEFAQLLAAKIGREANVDGLREILRLRDVELMQRAAGSYAGEPSRRIPQPLEALIVEGYGDAKMRPALLGFLARQMEKRERYPKYQGRRLFELLYADLRGADPFGTSIRIVATDLEGIEPELAAALPALGAAAANEIVMFLGLRRYAAGVPALLALQARIPHERNENQVLEHVNWALLQIGTPEATGAVLDRLRALGRSSDPRAASEVWVMLLNLSELPAGSGPGLAAVREALPTALNESSWDTLVKMALEKGDAADWRDVRERLGREQKLSPERKAPLERRLDAALADPAKQQVDRAQAERAKSFQAAQARLNADAAALAPLRESDPRRYGVEQRALLERREALLRDYADVPAAAGGRPGLASEYGVLAAHLRFRARDADGAIAAYDHMRALQAAESAIDLASLLVADTYRFDKKDAKAAAAQYHRFLGSLGQAKAKQAGAERLVVPFQRWIQYEIAYLESGRRFSGALTREDVQVLQVLMLFGIAAAERQPVSPQPSHLHLAAEYFGNPRMPADEIRRRLSRHDPTGYLVAAMVAVAELRDSGALKADPRFATAERTWAHFLDSAKKGDAAGMLSCFTEDMRGKLQGLFERLSAKQLADMGASFVAISFEPGSGTFRDAMTVRQAGERKQAGVVTFVNQGGEWKIDAM